MDVPLSARATEPNSLYKFKKSVLAIALTGFFVFARGQDYFPEQLYNKATLKSNQIKSIRVYLYTVTPEDSAKKLKSNYRWYADIEIDKEGRTLVEKGLTNTTKYTYDEAGFLAMKEFFNQGKLIGVYKVKHDPATGLKTSYSYADYATRKNSSSAQLEYDKKGRLLSETRYDTTGTPAQQYWYKYGSNDSLEFIGFKEGNTETIQDNKYRVVEQNIYDKDGKKMLSKTYTYYQTGELKKITGSDGKVYFDAEAKPDPVSPEKYGLDPEPHKNEDLSFKIAYPPKMKKHPNGLIKEYWVHNGWTWEVWEIRYTK